jgi:hypothetical protein
MKAEQKMIIGLAEIGLHCSVECLNIIGIPIKRGQTVQFDIRSESGKLLIGLNNDGFPTGHGILWILGDQQDFPDAL